MSTLTRRETVVSLLNNNPVLTTLGLIEDGVVQADTVESPTAFPFIVVRWIDEEQGLGSIHRDPLELWVYDVEGDYSRAVALGQAALGVLAEAVQEPTKDGHLMLIETKGLGLGRGRDLYDDAYSAVVVPFRARAIGTGS